MLYAFVLAPPTEDIKIKNLAAGGLYDHEIANISILGSSENLTWSRNDMGLTIQLAENLPDLPVIGFRITTK